MSETERADEVRAHVRRRVSTLLMCSGGRPSVTSDGSILRDRSNTNRKVLPQHAELVQLAQSVVALVRVGPSKARNWEEGGVAERKSKKDKSPKTQN